MRSTASPGNRWLAHVYSAVIGHQIDHLHLHLIPRYPEAVARFVAELRH